MNNGHFVVTWQSVGQDGSYGGIYGQIFEISPSVPSETSLSLSEIPIASSAGRINGMVPTVFSRIEQTIKRALDY